jgi:hypothetical protein
LHCTGFGHAPDATENDARKRSAIAFVMLLAQKSALSWNEVVAALGLASDGLAVAASTQADGSREDCLEHARSDPRLTTDVDFFSPMDLHWLKICD